MERYSNFRGKAILFLLFLWCIWFFSFSVRIIFSPILPIVEDEFMVTHAKASSIFIFLSFGYGIAVISSGLFSGKFGYKKSIVFSLLLLSLVAFLIPFVHNLFLLYLFAFVLGFSVGIYLPSAIPLITEYYSEKNWGKAIAIHDTGASISIFATPFVALFLLHFFPWRGIFVVFACIFLVCSIVFHLGSSEVKISHSPKAMFRDIVRIRSLWLMAIMWTFGAGSNLGIYSIVPLYLTKELQLNIDYANTILGISRLGSVGVAITCGFLIDRFNLRKVMFLLIIITSFFTILLGLTPVKYIGIILFLQAFFVTGFFPVGLVAIAKTFSREMRSLATGIILAISIFSGGGIIPYFLGISGDLYSFRLGIIILGIFAALTSTLVFHLKELE
ncbi:MAG: MFS transporter [Proteobacteria bacterium]|nr:MFS transporter [Pseudomonadota bacterium]